MAYNPAKLTMDKTSIDDSDDFGAEKPERLGHRARFTSKTLIIWLLVTTAFFGIERYLVFLELFGNRSGSVTTVSVGPVLIGQDTFRSLVMSAALIQQLSLAYTFVVVIVLSDRWGWAKFPPSTIGRYMFEAIKWILVVALFLGDAIYLEHIYESALMG